MSIVSRQGFLKVMVISLVIVFGLGVLFGRAEAITLGELVRVGPDGLKPTIVVDKLIFSDFESPFNEGMPKAELDQIKVEPIGAGTAHAGLRFIPMKPESAGSDPPPPPPWSLDSDMITWQRTQISYKVAHLDELPLIKESSSILFPGNVTGGDSASVSVEEEILDEAGASIGAKEVNHKLGPDDDGFLKLDQALSDKVVLSSAQKGFFPFVTVLLQARPKSLNRARVSIGALEHRFTLAPSMGVAPAGKVVFDEVTLDGGTSIDGEYLWELKHRDNPEFDKVITDEKNPLVKGLEPGLYDVTLTVTTGTGIDLTVKHIATMLLAAAGACEDQGGSLPAALHLWRFKIKKYKYCNWAFARVYGTVDASDLPLDSSIDQDELTAKVILQVLDIKGNTVGEWSAETAAEIKDRRYKYVIQNKW